MVILEHFGVFSTPEKMKPNLERYRPVAKNRLGLGGPNPIYFIGNLFLINEVLKPFSGSKVGI